MKLKLLFVLFLVSIVSVGCTDAVKSSYSALSRPHIIKQFSGGQIVGQWESTGAVENEAHSDGYYFEDSKTHKMIRVSGQVQIFTE